MENADAKKEQLSSRSADMLSSQIKILSPGIWILVIALVVLFAGGFMYACLGNVDLEMPVCGYAEGGKVQIFIRDDNFAAVRLGQKVVFKNTHETGTLTGYSSDPMMIPDLISEEYLTYGSYHTGEIVYVFTAKADIPDGPWFASIVTGSVHPITLLFD